MANIKYRVQEAPTGPYRSFHHRGWPIGHHRASDNSAVSFFCEDDYHPAKVRTGDHREITISVAQPHKDGPGFTWRRLKKRAATLDEAKKIATRFFDAHPDWIY